MDSTGLDPFALFKGLEDSSLGNQLNPVAQFVGESWRGFVLNIENLNLAVPFVGEFEIIPFQELSPIPMSKDWVKGMTNIRGEIYTVVDIAEFIGFRPIRITKQCHLFLLPDRRLKSALLIDSKVSLRSFNSELPTSDVTTFHDGLTDYLSSVIVDGDIQWGVVDIETLCNSNAFANIGG